MKAKKYLKDSELFKRFNPIRDVLCDFVSYLDIPEYRKGLLDTWPVPRPTPEPGLDRAMSDCLVWWLREQLDKAFDVPVVVIEEDETITDAIYKLVMSISTREDRIVACRQIMRFPMDLAVIDGMDPALDGNARYVAHAVRFALEAITRRMSELAEVNNPKGGRK